MASPAVRIGLFTAGLLVVFVGLAIAVVGWAGSAPALAGFGRGVPQVLLGAAVTLVGVFMAWTGWEMAKQEEAGPGDGPLAGGRSDRGLEEE